MSIARSQRTLVNDAVVSGVGFVTGAPVELRLRSAEPDAGISFRRVDLPGHPVVAARIDHVVSRSRRTTLQSGSAVVEMVEHVLAALAGLEVDNCQIELNAGETPGLDGSSGPFVDAIRAAGIIEQNVPRRSFVVDQSYTVRDGDAILAIHPPTSDGFAVQYYLDYGPRSPIPRQSYFTRITPHRFDQELARSRTFLLLEEADALRKQGIGGRATPRDLLVFGPTGPIDNQLRFDDEPARHKILDVVGDLALLGCDLVGHVVAHKSGHKLNVSLVSVLKHAMQERDVRPLRSTTLDVQEICRRLPHRYPFLLVDRVTELEPGRRAVGIKNVTVNEPFFEGHWPGRPIMPGVLVVEAMAQLAGLIFSDGPARPDCLNLLLSMDQVKLRRPVVPGDQLRLEAEVVRARLRTSQVKTLAKIDNQVAAEAELRFIRVDANAA